MFKYFKPFIGLGLLIVIGTFCYSKIEGWNFLDSLFMSVQTITTVGYGELIPLSIEGRIFTIIYIVFGVMLFFHLSAEFAKVIFMSSFETIWKKRAMENKLKKFKNHYIVCGYGRTGNEIAQILKNENLNFVVIDKNESLEETFLEAGIPYVIGDSTDDHVLELAGIEQAKCLFCALDGDVDNLYLTVSAKNINPQIKIIARCIKASNEIKFKKGGASSTILPYEISARRMVASVVKPLVVDFLDVFAHNKEQDFELQLEQVHVIEGSPVANTTIKSSKIKDQSGAIIVAIKRDKDFMISPKPDETIQANDYLVAVGTGKQLKEMEKIIVS